MTRVSKKNKLSTKTIKSILGESQYQDAKTKIDKAETTLEEVKQIFSSALFLQEGSLLYGTIEYAAFRIETLSLIFDLAAKHFNKSSGSGAQAYKGFLRDLGAEVGFTYARDIVGRIEDHGLFPRVNEIGELIELWIAFENDTGAGVTSLKSITKKQCVIQIDNNPLRKIESEPHSHCDFYRYYIRSLLNEMMSSRARILQSILPDASLHADKVYNIEEGTESNGSCVFVAKFRKERLVRAFDTLHEAYNQFYRHDANDDFSPCAAQARAALQTAQMEALGITDERTPRQLYKVFNGILPNETYKRMRNAYHSFSKYVHKESPSSKKLVKARCLDLLRDVRRTLIDLELCEIPDDKKLELRKKAGNIDDIKTIEDAVSKSTTLSESEKENILKLINNIKNGISIEEKDQSYLLEYLKKFGEKIWEIAKPILRDIITDSLRKEYGL